MYVIKQAAEEKLNGVGRRKKKKKRKQKSKKSSRSWIKSGAPKRIFLKTPKKKQKKKWRVAIATTE